MRHVLVMTAAASVGLMSIFMVDLLSMIYVSRLGDPNLTAAVAYATQVLFFLVSINIGLSIALGALTARAIGAGDWPGAQRIAASGLVHVILLLGSVGGAAFFFRREILVLFGAQGAALEVGARFLALTLPATIPLGLGMSLAALLRAVGDARRAMFVTLSGAVVTAALDPIFIFGLGLGVEGAAIVTVISRLVLVAVGFLGAIRRHGLVGRPQRKAILLDAPAILAIAGPAILANLAAPVANAYAMRVFSGFGESVVAAFAIIDRVMPVAFGVVFALSGSVGPIIAQNLGARRIQRVRQTLTNSFAFSAVYVLIVAALLRVAAPIVVRLFDAHGETAELVRFFCAYGGALWIFLGAIFVANAAFNNLGFPIFSTAFNWGRATLGSIPFMTIGAAHFGPKGGYVGLIVGAALFGAGAVFTAYAVTARLAKRPKAA